MPDYHEFLRMLRKEPGRAVIFEPFPTREIVTQLLWRGGAHMWDTTEHRVSTLISFYSYIKSDVVIIEAADDLGKILEFSNLLPDKMKFVIISENRRMLEAADESDSVCATATCLRKISGLKKPCILLLRQGETCDIPTVSEFSGIYISSAAEKYISEMSSVKTTVLGGLSVDYINNSEPLEIYERVKLLHELSNKTWVIGSGGFGEHTEYLGFISMLGVYNKLI